MMLVIGMLESIGGIGIGIGIGVRVVIHDEIQSRAFILKKTRQWIIANGFEIKRIECGVWVF